MALVDPRIVAAQPDAADRESGVTFALRDARFLQERQRAAAGTEVDEPGRRRVCPAVCRVLGIKPPEAAGVATKMGDPLSVVDCKSSHSDKMTNKAAGKRPVVHIRADDDARRGHLLIGGAALHDQGYPLRKLVLVLRALHTVVTVMGGHRCKALSEEGDVLRPMHEAHVRDGMDEALRVRNRSGLHQIGPELTREIELGVDVERLGDVDGPVGTLRRVVELAICRMSGPRVIPGIGTLKRRTLEGFEHLYVECGLKFLQKHAQRSAHDTSTHQDDVGLP